MKANNPGFFPFQAVAQIFGLGILTAFWIPEPVKAQQSSNKVEVSFPGFEFIYQGGRKSSRGIKTTTSSIALPDLNAILAPTPVEPKAKTTPSQNSNAEDPTPQSSAAQGPRFGYGSGPVQPPGFDPRIPIDPGYDPGPAPAPAATTPQPAPAVSPPIANQPSIQIEQTTTIPFAHDYYPRSYLPAIPFFPHHHHHSFDYYGGVPGCGFGGNPAPLRGSFTSSRNYLSGLRIPGLSLRLSF